MLVSSTVSSLSATVPDEEQSQAKVLIFIFKMIVEQHFRAGGSMNTPPAAILKVSCYFMMTLNDKTKWIHTKNFLLTF